MMDEVIAEKLLQYQIPHANNIIGKLKSKGICLDGSDTGVGKTYVAMAIAKYLDMQPFIFCPKTIINAWEKVAGIFNVKPLGVVNYETAIIGKYYDTKGKRVINPYVTYNKETGNPYKWNFPLNTFLIFDEVHRCCGEETRCGQLLLSAIKIYSPKLPLLIISATVANDFSHIKMLSVTFRWFKSINWVPDWMKNKDFNPKRARLLMNQKIFPEYGCRIRICELGDLFPKSQLTADCYNIDNKSVIDGAYKELGVLLKNLENKKIDDKENAFVQIIRIRQKIEICKISLFIDLANQYRENGYSVLIFMNFTDSLKLLADKLKTKCLVYGEQTLKERLKNIEDFMENKERIIILNVASGGESISLHDKYGDHPRVALISPTWSSSKLIQACGRIHRSDAKTASLNKIIYAAKTIEQKMCNKLEAKLSNLSSITDDDLGMKDL